MSSGIHSSRTNFFFQLLLLSLLSLFVATTAAAMAASSSKSGDNNNNSDDDENNSAATGALLGVEPRRVFTSDVSSTTFKVTYVAVDVTSASRLSLNDPSCSCWMTLQILRFNGDTIFASINDSNNHNNNDDDDDATAYKPGVYKVSLIYKLGISLRSNLTLEVIPHRRVINRRDVGAASAGGDSCDSDCRLRLALGLGLGLGLSLLAAGALCLGVALCLRRSRSRARETAWRHNDKVVMEFLEKSKTLKTGDRLPAMLQMMSNVQGSQKAGTRKDSQGAQGKPSVLGAFVGHVMLDVDDVGVKFDSLEPQTTAAAAAAGDKKESTAATENGFDRQLQQQKQQQQQQQRQQQDFEEVSQNLLQSCKL